MIYKAIAENVKIRFQYFEWNVKKEMRLRRDGMFYQVSPWLLSWDDENYYLIAVDERCGEIRHYRVDKMIRIGLLDEAREGRAQFESFDIAAYSKKTFGMFAGKEETVTICCDSSLTGVMIDRFGTEAALREKGESRIQVRVNVAVSRQFFGWITGLGPSVKIDAPRHVAEAYRDYLREILAQYEV